MISEMNIYAKSDVRWLALCNETRKYTLIFDTFLLAARLISGCFAAEY